MNRRYPIVLAAIAAGLLLPAAAAAEAPAPGAAEAERALEQARALLDGAGDGEGRKLLAGPGGEGSRDVTLVLRELALGLDELSEADRHVAERLLSRPGNGKDGDSFGREATRSPVCDPNFCVHWGTAKRARPPKVDRNANGVPDYVESVLVAAQRSYDVENGIHGWPEAVSDGRIGARRGIGAGGQTDIYLAGLERGVYGYASTGPGKPDRVNPSYLVLDNDYARFKGIPIELMRVTLAHEYNHVLQFGIDTFQDLWMFEATATYVEDHVFPSIDDYLNFVEDFARKPTYPMAEPRGSGVKIYGSAVWNHYIASRWGDDVVLAAWLRSAEAEPRHFAVGSYDLALRARGSEGFSPEFVSFAAETAEWNSSPAFPDAASYAIVKRRGHIGTVNPQSFKLPHTGYRLLDVKPESGTLTLRVKAGEDVRSGIALVGRAGPFDAGTVESDVVYLPNGGTAQVQLPAAERFDRVTAVVVNADGRVRDDSRRYRKDAVPFRVDLSR